MKPGYKTRRYKIRENDQCIIVVNFPNEYVECPLPFKDFTLGKYDVGVWIPKNPDGTSKQRPDNWPNKTRQ